MFAVAQSHFLLVKRLYCLLEEIKDIQEDLLEPVRQKFCDKNLNFELKFVSEEEVLQIIKKLKKKIPCGFDQISAEILKMGAIVLVKPLTKIINQSIRTSKFPTKWKDSKVCPVYKKGDRQTLKNYRPVSLLSQPVRR